MNNKILFCENCNELTEQSVCPKCGKPAREPQANDLCLIDEFNEMGKSMLADALSNNDIEFVAIPVHGGFTQLNTPTGYKIYVRYADYEQAVEILNTIFGGQDEQQLDDPASVIDSLVKVVIDRPLGSVHPEHPDIKYELNYGHVDGVIGGDGEEQDAYVLDLPKGYTFVGKEVDGFIVAVIRRKNDVETKWVVSAGRREKYTREEIAQAVHFQEKYFDIEIIM